MGVDRARQGTEMQMLDGAGVVRLVEAIGAGSEAAGVGPDADDGTRAAVFEELESEEEWVGWSMGDWVAGTGVHDEEVAGAEAGVGAEQRPEAAAGDAVVWAGASTEEVGPGTTDAKRAAVKQVGAVEGAPGEVQGRKWGR